VKASFPLKHSNAKDLIFLIKSPEMLEMSVRFIVKNTWKHFLAGGSEE